MIALLAGVAFGAVVLPEPPVRPADLDPGECEETGIENGQPEFDLGDCSGLVLPLSQWQYLERAAVYNGQIERRWVARELEYTLQLEHLQRELDRANEPIPFFSRPAFYTLFGAITTGAILVGYHHAVTPG